MSEVVAKAVSKRRFCWHCKGFHLFILCHECGHSACVKCGIKEINDEEGYPHFGWPVCPNCGKDNHHFRHLTQCQAYVNDGYIPEERIWLPYDKVLKEKSI